MSSIDSGRGAAGDGPEEGDVGTLPLHPLIAATMRTPRRQLRPRCINASGRNRLPQDELIRGLAHCQQAIAALLGFVKGRITQIAITPRLVLRLARLRTSRAPT